MTQALLPGKEQAKQQAKPLDQSSEKNQPCLSTDRWFFLHSIQVVKCQVYYSATKSWHNKTDISHGRISYAPPSPEVQGVTNDASANG